MCYPSPYTLVLERVSGGTVTTMRRLRAAVRWASRAPRAAIDWAWGRWGPTPKSTSSLENGAWLTPSEFLDGLARAGVYCPREDDADRPTADYATRMVGPEVRN